MQYMPIIEGRIRHMKLVEFYTQAVLKELGLGRLRTRPIQIEFGKHAEGAFGYCNGSKEFAVIRIAKTCPVTKRNLSFLEMMKTLAHELVHAKQFLRGELINECGWKWKGRNADGYEYDNQPWEKEAFRREEELFAKCFPWHIPFKN
jgi:hypothetical protein